MKEVAFSMWKWIAVGVLVAVVGGMLVLGIGRKRGTRTYRWRIALWTLALGLLGGTALVASSCDAIKPEPMCYDPIQEPADARALDATASDTVSADLLITCYKMAPDVPTQPDVPAKPDVVVMCYEDIPADLVPQPDVLVQPDIPVMCYAEVPADWLEQPDTTSEPDTKAVPDIPEMCYFAGDFGDDATS